MKVCILIGLKAEKDIPIQNDKLGTGYVSSFFWHKVSLTQAHLAEVEWESKDLGTKLPFLTLSMNFLPQHVTDHECPLCHWQCCH